jgi:hypothetical protein
VSAPRLRHFASSTLFDPEAELERLSDGRSFGAGRERIGVMNLADYECRHGRLPGDRSAPCGCYPNERPSDEPLLEPGDSRPVLDVALARARADRLSGR